MSGADVISRRALIGAGLIVASLPRSAYAEENVVVAKVKTTLGFYISRSEHNVDVAGVWNFPGIRYGHAQRFAVPVAASRAEQPYLPTFGSVSPQKATTEQSQSEDCLFLNLWALTLNKARRPVMVYIHGGAYSNGTGNDPLTDGARLAERGDVVVVTVTHRLNAFGYLSLGRIESCWPDSGNAGQLDLICALQWVRDNIAEFGGDPANVTVFGQSGGGAKIATLMAMPAAKGLFHKAATMSGQQVTASGPLNAEKRARAYLAKLGIDLVKATVEDLVAALDTVDPIMGDGLYFGPVLDGRNLLRHPFWPDAAPQGNSIPMMMGNCIAETRAFFPTDHPKLRGLDWTNIATRMAHELRVDIDPEMVVRTYRSWFPELSPSQIFIKATTAGRSWRGQIIEAEARANAGVPAFVYQLDFEDAMHTGDIGLVFGTKPDMTPAQRAVSDRMMAAFVRFARTGNPGWAPYDLAKRETMMFDTVSRVESNPRGRERELFGVVPYVQPGS